MPPLYDDRSEWDLFYEGSFFPYLYDGKDGSLRGFIPIMWNIIGQALQKEIRYHEISNNQVQVGNDSFHLSDVLIWNGTYLSFMDGSEMTQKKMPWARYSVPFLYGRYQIYESLGEQEHEISFLSYYVVFSWSTILLLFICVVVFNFTLWLHKKLLPREHKGFISHMLLSAAQALFLLSITLTTFYHGAYFRGDTIVTVPPRPSTLTQLLTSLDRRYMLLDQRNLTNNNVQFQPDKALFFKQLCTDRNAFTFLFSGEKYQRTIINASCVLSQVTLSSLERTTYKPFERMGIDSPYVIMTPRNLTSRRLMDRINGIILKLFQDEQIVNVWNPRSVDSLRHYYDDEAKPTAEFNPMSLDQLSIVFYLFLGGAGAAILLMLAEKIYHKILHRHNLISMFKSRSSAIVKKYSVAARQL